MADVTVSPATAREASECWIQPAYIGHARYYGLMANLRAAKVPVKYFSRTGVSSCAREMLANP